MRELVDHVVHEVRRYAASSATGDRGSGDGAAIGAEVAGWPGAFRAAADSLLAAWRTPGAFDLPGGVVPASWSVRQQLTELVVHSWDIAKATGQPTELDPELGATALAFGQENLVREIRGEESTGHQIAAEIPVPADAPLYARLAAFCGRNPN